MSKLTTSTSDKTRAILTDVLPYETPIIFSNEGLYEYINGDRGNVILNSICNYEKQGTLPYNYRINKGINSKRTLSVPHPATQIHFSSLYDKYDSLIIELCSRSSFSIRKPVKVASAFYESNQLSIQLDTEKGVEEERGIESTQQRYSSSYFVYGRYNFVYKFYESYEFHRLEKRFRLHYRFDISKCFPSIYTHTVAWAIKGKSYAKKHRLLNSFEQVIDKAMQHANDLETHGIIVGPEFSRIFAEIILQRIDLDVEKKLADLGYRHKSEYAIRRYIDDYFVFYNDMECLDAIVEAYKSKLEEYKLFINEAKNASFVRPFVTPVSAAKLAVLDYVRWFSKATLPMKMNSEDADEIRSIRVPHVFSNKCIARLKVVLGRHNAQYYSVSRIALSTLHKKLVSFLRMVNAVEIDQKLSEELKTRLWVFLDFLFFVYSMDVTPRTTHILSRTITALNHFIHKLNRDDSSDIKKKISDEINIVVSNSYDPNSSVSIEICNLMLLLSILDYETPNYYNVLLKGFNIRQESLNVDHLRYFSIMSLLFCMNGRNEFADLQKQVEAKVVDRISRSTSPIRDTEVVLMFLDFVSCDHVAEKERKGLVKSMLQAVGANVATEKINASYNYISKRKWFVDWDSSAHFDQTLAKKELRTPY